MFGRSHPGPRFAVAPVRAAAQAVLAAASGASTAVPVTPKPGATRAKLDRAYDDGFAAGRRKGRREASDDAVMAENARCEAILCSAEGQANPDLAFRLAFRSGESAKAARRVMRDAGGAQAGSIADGYGPSLSETTGDQRRLAAAGQRAPFSLRDAMAKATNGGRR